MFTGKLDNYQQEAVDKFLSRGNLLVAYIQGSGKTPIAIACAEELLRAGEVTAVLVVCPSSLKYQWAQKIAEFTDCPVTEMSLGDERITVPYGSFCAIADGDRDSRERIYAAAGLCCPSYIVCSYDTVLSDPAIAAFNAGLVILDEATAIKSFKAARSKKVKKALRSHYRIALTGTPVENRPDELFSVMQWVDDTVLGRYDLFERAYISRNKYGWVVSYKNLHVLREKISPAVARVSDDHEEVKALTPDVVEADWVVPMPAGVRRVYGVIASQMLQEMQNLSPYADFSMHDYYGGSDESTIDGKLMAMYTCLEMLVDHPDLIVYSALRYESGRKGGSKFAYDLWQSGELDDVVSSGKTEMVVSSVPDKAVNGSKVLIYSKYKYMLDLLSMELRDVDIDSVCFHGGMSPRRKAAAVARFTNDPECNVFLSSHAGAYGMDMHMAQWLINYDLPWSSGRRDQINYRHKRRSSLFSTVYVTNLIAAGSFEERRLRILDRKKRLAGAILDGWGADSSGRLEIDGDSLSAHLTDFLSANRIVTEGG